MFRVGQVVPVRQKASGIYELVERTPRDNLHRAKHAVPNKVAGAGFVKHFGVLNHSEVQRWGSVVTIPSGRNSKS